MNDDNSGGTRRTKAGDPRARQQAAAAPGQGDAQGQANIQALAEAITNAIQGSMPTPQDQSQVIAQAVTAAINQAFQIQAQAQAQAQAAQAQASAQAQGQAAIPNLRSPFDSNDVLDLSSKTGAALYAKGSAELPEKYSGKPTELRTFITHLRARANNCRWSNIITIQKGGQNLNLLDDYGKLTRQDIDQERTTRDGAQNVSRDQQNSTMMFECIWNSISGPFAIKLSDQVDHRDGPTLFYNIIGTSHTTTFSHLHHTRNNLQNVSPKTYNYNITKMNEYINGVFQQQDATDSSLSDQEKLFYLFQAYQRIRSPNEWVSYVDSIKADFDHGNVGFKPYF